MIDPAADSVSARTSHMRPAARHDQRSTPERSMPGRQKDFDRTYLKSVTSGWVTVGRVESGLFGRQVQAIEFSPSQSAKFGAIASVGVQKKQANPTFLFHIEREEVRLFAYGRRQEYRNVTAILQLLAILKLASKEEKP